MGSDHVKVGSLGRGKGIALIILGFVLIVTGLFIPSQFKSLPLVLIKEAGKGSDQVETFILELVNAGHLGAAMVVAEGVNSTTSPKVKPLKKQIEDFAAIDVDLWVWGEWDSALKQVFTDDVMASLSPKEGAVVHFLPKEHRENMIALLQNSRDRRIQALLETRELSSYQKFMPSFSAAGQPLDATVLLISSLLQEEKFSGSAARTLAGMAQRAAASGDAGEIEQFYLSMLTLGRHYNWGQLSELTKRVVELDTLEKIASLVRVMPEGEIDAVYATSIFSGDPEGVVEYLITYGDTGREALRYALGKGKGSVMLLLRHQLPPAGEIATEMKGVRSRDFSGVNQVVSFALREPMLALVVKYLLYFAGAFSLFWAFDLFTGLARFSSFPAFASIRRGVGALLLCLLLVLLNEPYLARGSQLSGYEFKIVIPVLGSTSQTLINTPSTQGYTMDVATILSILFFFILQLLVYLICINKINQIDSKEVSNLVKLRLMENEENLFDSGLYVGIAGTSAALVLQVLGLIEANLLAAYASNLLGILCVAFVKIRNVRPYKTGLIEASEIESHS
jgi:hypothetical protein